MSENIPHLIKIAIVAHEANRAWCIANNDFSQPSWNEAPDWQQESAINGVLFHRNNPEAGNSASHDSWMQEKLENGWVYGEEKDPEASPPTHPCIVPYEDLPEVQRLKDSLFRSIIHGLLREEDKA